jgi:hypothetical protein
MLVPEQMKAVENLHAYQKWDEGLGGQENETKEYQSWRLNAAAKPAHRSLWQIRAKMGWTFPSDKKNKTRLLLLGRHQRQGATALLKCRQPLLFLHLAQLCKLQGFIIYKRAFVVYPLHSTNWARTFFLTGEAREGTRFLMRRRSCTLKHQYNLWSPNTVSGLYEGQNI